MRKSWRPSSTAGRSAPSAAATHIAELSKRAAETDAKLKRLYDAIESGVADLDDPMLKERIAELKAIRDQAQADAERAEGELETLRPAGITPQMVQTFARTARKRMRIEGGGYRRDHLRALAQRVEVDRQEVRIMGSKSDTAAHPRRRFKRKNGGFWRAQFCTEVARPTQFERALCLRSGAAHEFLSQIPAMRCERSAPRQKDQRRG